MAVEAVIITLRDKTELLLLSERSEENKPPSGGLIVRWTTVLRKRKSLSVELPGDNGALQIQSNLTSKLMLTCYRDLSSPLSGATVAGESGVVRVKINKIKIEVSPRPRPLYYNYEGGIILQKSSIGLMLCFNYYSSVLYYRIVIPDTVAMR